MNRNIKLLERTYLAILAVVLGLIVLTPYIVRSGFTLLEEQLAEVITILLLFAVGYAVLRLYRKEAGKNLHQLKRLRREKGTLDSRLSDAFEYIGAVNVQIQEIKSVFSDIRKFPETRKDFAHILHFLAERTLGMVNTDWVLLRIISNRDLNTLNEYVQMRGNAVPLKPKISNRDLGSNNTLKEFTVIGSGHENFHIRTFCILPKAKLAGDQKVFIEAVLNQLEMLFLIFTSIYYQNNIGDNHNCSDP